jgi:hypothetical protein
MADVCATWTDKLAWTLFGVAVGAGGVYVLQKEGILANPCGQAPAKALPNPRRKPKYEYPGDEELNESWVIADGRRGGYALFNEGRQVTTSDDFDDLVARAIAEMDRNQFWPNLYYQNERGNLDLLDRRGKTLASWV